MKSYTEKIADLFTEAIKNGENAQVFANKATLLFLAAKYDFIAQEDLEFAIWLQKDGGRLEAVKWLSDKIKPHTSSPLFVAKQVLDAHYEQPANFDSIPNK